MAGVALAWPSAPPCRGWGGAWLGDLLAAFPLVPIVFFLSYELADVFRELRVSDAEAFGVVIVDRP